MYIEITDKENPIISKFDQERDLFVGAEFTNPIKIKWPDIENSYVTLSYENSRHMKYGPVYADDITKHVATFNCTNKRILVPGDLQISIFINVTDGGSKTIKRYAVGVVAAIIKKAVYDSGNIIIADDDDSNSIIMDMKDSLEKTNNLVASINDQLKEVVKDDGNFEVMGNMNVRGNLTVKNDPVVCKKEFDENTKLMTNKINDVFNAAESRTLILVNYDAIEEATLNYSQNFKISNFNRCPKLDEYFTAVYNSFFLEYRVTEVNNTYETITAKVVNSSNIKGDKGDNGNNGLTPTIRVVQGNEINVPGTPSVTLFTEENVSTFTFNYLKGERGSVGPAGNAGPPGPQGDKGKDGTDGKDGITPHIGSNGNWYLGDTDTGVLARGTNGADGKDGINGTNGTAGVTPVIKVAEGDEIGVPGTPSVNISTQGNVNTFTFNHLKGDKGDKGEPGDAGKQTGVLRRVFDFDFAEKGLDSIEYYSNSAWETDLLGYVPSDGDNVMAIDVKSHIGTFQIVGPVYLTSGNEGYGMKLKSYTSIKGDKGDPSTVPGPKGDPGCSFSLSGTTLTITWNT